MKIKLTALLPVACAMAMAVASLSADPYVHDSDLEFHFQEGVGSLEWHGAEGFTYFVQHSLELGEPWVYVPNLVLQGEDDLLSIGYSSSEAVQSFFKLQFTDLPYTEDLDGDGWTNIEEINANRDPLDFFNAQTPLVTLVSGDGQGDLPELFLAYPLTVSVANSEGTPLRNAADAVTFSILSGGGGQLSLSNTGSDPLLGTLPVSTDAEGLARAYVKLPATVGALTIQASAVNQQGLTASVEFTASVGDPTLAPAAPSDVVVERDANGDVLLSWRDLSNNETGFTIERWTFASGWTALTPGAPIGANATTFLDEDAPENVPVAYRVTTNNASGGGPGGGPSSSDPSEANIEDPYLDPDEDGLANLDELIAKTDPNNSNTDGDLDEQNNPILDGMDGFPLLAGFSPERLPRPSYAVIDLGYPEGYIARYINDKAQAVVQGLSDGDGYNTFYLWDKGVSTQILGPAGTAIHEIEGLNNHGAVVGLFVSRDVETGFWKPDWADENWRPAGTEPHYLTFVWRKTENGSQFDYLRPHNSVYGGSQYHKWGNKINDSGMVVGCIISADLQQGTRFFMNRWPAPFSNPAGELIGPAYISGGGGYPLSPITLNNQGVLIAYSHEEVDEYVWPDINPMGDSGQYMVMNVEETTPAISSFHQVTDSHILLNDKGHLWLSGNKLLINANTGPKDDQPPGDMPDWDEIPITLQAGVNVADLPNFSSFNKSMQGVSSAGNYYRNSIAEPLNVEGEMTPTTNLAEDGLMAGQMLQPASTEPPSQVVKTVVLAEVRFEEVLPSAGLDYQSTPNWLMVPQEVDSSGASTHVYAITPAKSGSPYNFEVRPPEAAAVQPGTTQTGKQQLIASSGTVGESWLHVGPPGALSENGLLGISVKPRKEVTVALHGVTQLNPDGSKIAPEYVPTVNELETYLNRVYGKQVNVWFTVTRALHEVNYDLNGNGELDMSGNPNIGPEEVVLNSQVRDSDKDINVYCVHLMNLGTAVGKAISTDGIVYIEDFEEVAPLRTQFTIAHEIGHCFNMGHADSNVNMALVPQANVTVRLMYSTVGTDESILSYPLLIKTEWDRIHQPLK